MHMASPDFSQGNVENAVQFRWTIVMAQCCFAVGLSLVKE